MPKSKVSRKKMFRDFSFLKDRYVNNNHLKNLHSVRMQFCKNHDVDWKHLEFMLWAYDLEFFTIQYASDEYGYNKNNMGNRIIYPLQADDYVYQHFGRLTPSQSLDDHLFRSETKYNYRVRYALTQRARLLVQRFYQSL